MMTHPSHAAQLYPEGTPWKPCGIVSGFQCAAGSMVRFARFSEEIERDEMFGGDGLKKASTSRSSIAVASIPSNILKVAEPFASLGTVDIPLADGNIPSELDARKSIGEQHGITRLGIKHVVGQKHIVPIVP